MSQSGDNVKTAAALIIGDEILSGRIEDANGPHLARTLDAAGLRLIEMRVVGDAPDGITRAVRDLSSRVDHLFTTGGIGPTHDDLTADAVAAAFDVAIGVRADALAILQAYYGQGGINDARRRMARIPDGAALIDNPVSRAPGFSLHGVHVMAGVPIIFREMLAGLLPRLERGAPLLSWSLRAPVPEGDIAADLAALDAAHPDVSIGVYPFYRGGLGCTIVLRAADREALSAAAADARSLLTRALPADGAIAETPPETPPELRTPR